MSVAQYTNLFEVTHHNDGMVRIVFLDENSAQQKSEAAHVVMTKANADALAASLRGPTK